MLALIRWKAVPSLSGSDVVNDCLWLLAVTCRIMIAGDLLRVEGLKGVVSLEWCCVGRFS